MHCDPNECTNTAIEYEYRVRQRVSYRVDSAIPFDSTGYGRKRHMLLNPWTGRGYIK